MRIVAVPCLAADLQPGDLFSSVGPEFWDDAHLGHMDETSGERAVGVKCYIRTQAQPTVMGVNLTQVYKIHIVSDEIEQQVGMDALKARAREDIEDPLDRPRLEVVPDEDSNDLGPE